MRSRQEARYLMCGIFGALFVPPGEHVDVDAALRSIRYRGPDLSKVFRGDGVVLGFNRLAILDLSPLGDQPMASADGQVIVVFNGEIYNHHALREELVRAGHTFRSRSDTEVIVEGYRAWKDDIIRRIDGMFALCIYDVREKRALLARDRAGKKPLFYARKGASLRFASEAKALIASGLPAEMDPAALPMMLAMGYTQAPRTMYRGIEQLPPASWLLLEEGRAPEIRRYWSAPFAEPPLDVGVDEACDEVRRLMEAAVKRRLEADVPLGAFLSGGIDSTIIVGLMARLMGRKVKTFSIGFAGDKRFDETAYARIASRAFETEHVEFRLEASSFEHVERLVALHDGPFGDSSAIPTSIVSQLTREHVTVALTGDGGDEVFCGYPRFLAADAAERIPGFLRRFGANVATAMPLGNSERTFGARARRFLSKAALPLPDRLVGWISLFAFDLEELLLPDVQAMVPMDEPLTYNRAILEQSRGATPLARTLDHNFETYLPFDLLVKADRSSMLHSLELRSPFLDTALVEYGARLPDGYKRRGTNMKWILKRAFRDLLPPEILTRGKMGFGMPLGAWFRTDLQGYLRDKFAPSAAMYQFLSRPFVERVMQEHFDGRADHGHRLWLLLTLEIWLRSLGRSPTL